MTELMGVGDDRLALAEWGDQVECTGVTRLPLGEAATMWMVTGGTFDLFAAAGGGSGRWTFLGRATTGTLVPGSPQNNDHVLVGRPSADCHLRRVQMTELDEARRHGDEALRRDLASGVDVGLRILLDALRPDLSLAQAATIALPSGEGLVLHEGHYGRVVDDIAWIKVEQGRLASSDGMLLRAGTAVFPVSGRGTFCGAPQAMVSAHTTLDLLEDGILWQQLGSRMTYLMGILQRRLEEQHGQDEAMLTAGRDAGKTVFIEAVRVVREHAESAPIDVPVDVSPSEPDAHGTPPIVEHDSIDEGTPGDRIALDAVRLVAEAAGIDRIRNRPVLGDRRLPPALRIVRAARIPHRSVRLRGTWWRTDIGPIVGHLQENGAPVALLRQDRGYVIVDPARQERTPVTAATAALLAPVGITLYRPLPDDVTSMRKLLVFGLHGCRSDLLRLVMSGTVAVTLSLLVPIAFGRILGDFVPDGQRSLIVQACLAVVAAGVVAMVFGVVQNLAVLRLEGRFEVAVQAGVWDRMLHLPSGFFNRYSTGELASAALSVNRIGELISGLAMTAVQAVLLTVVNLALQLWYNVPLALLSASLASVSVLVFVSIAKKLVVWQRAHAKLENALTNRVYQTLRGLPKLRTAAAEGYAYAQWAEAFVRSEHLRQRVQRLQNVVTVFDKTYVPFCTLMLLMLLLGPARNAMSADGILTFTVSFAAQLAATGQLIGALTSAGAVIPLFGQLEPILTEEPEVSSAKRHPGELSGAIELRNVSYRYSPDGPLVLDDVSVEIRPGEFLAVVGPSGSGKSSLLRLLVGFDSPVSGSVRYDDHDLADLDMTAVRGQCGVVLQHAEPFTGSILANIRGAEAYSMDEVREAVQMSGLADDIADLPMGVHTVLSDNGNTLSGGQRQRLMIAQALIRKPRMLFLDEATSALDNTTQQVVTNSTQALQATRVVIAHRLSTIMTADRVLVLAEGRVVQCGPPDELLKDSEGLFHQLARQQSV
ncbi:NHLP bacteriocin export ABC transporter permease/ATPase subunit [Lentzea tibetensis]|uniref:NHLP bacteriocin export ABC transporter permease/ATPase subunit n=1 Tax=Lentzea tibetensis TaxID=2591470 RepID=A0A563EGE2_9PSEU|nr:NHLP bacteriocin export ABC transporter permease/ATPase subunit [Lentzea tibetensis]TWP43573.1 NHLP bacteriocin export ABC transporter permease/ATPase subunit [Lentzea tibetensis]